MTQTYKVKIDFSKNKKQATAYDLMFSNLEYLEVLYGGAKYGGKSIYLCYFVWLWVNKLIKLLNLKATKYPIALGFMGRKRATDFSKTTLETWKQFIDPGTYTIKEQDKEIIFYNNVAKVHFGGLDDEKNVKKLNSAQYNFIAIDQAEEITRDEAGLLRGAVRKSNDQMKAPLRVLFTANPAHCWLRNDFIDTKSPSRQFIQALPSDNGYVDSASYVLRLTEAFKHRPELVNAYVYGQWDDIEGFDFVIKRQWVENAITRNERKSIYDKILVVADIARFGDDETVIYVLKNEQIIDERIITKTDTMSIAGEIVKLANQYNASMIAIDGIGIGAGVCDRVKELTDIKLLEINSSEKSRDIKDNEKYINVRAEMWWKVSEKFADGIVKLNKDDELTNQLTMVKYLIKNGKIKIEDKDEIKKRINKSPDRADAFVMGLWALDQCPNNNTSDWEGYQQPYYEHRRTGY